LEETPIQLNYAAVVYSLIARIEEFITDNTVAIDATHIEARDQAQHNGEKPKQEAKLSIFEKPIEAQLDVSLDNFTPQFLLIPSGVSRKTVREKILFGLVSKVILQ
jgi:hypothetical protein